MRGGAAVMGDSAVGSERQAVLSARDLSAGYDGRVVVGGASVEVGAGRIVALVGPNGAGKSTLLKAMAGQLEPLGGSVVLVGSSLRALPAREVARRRAVLLTDRPRPELLTCEDVVGLGRHPHTGRLGVLGDTDRRAVREAMELMEVWDLRGRDFLRVSDGQRQRVLLARAICQEPRVLMLDEPTSYLDVRYQIGLLRTLRALARGRGLGVVMSLHELQLARQASDWIVCVREGRVVLQGTPEEVFVPEVMDALYDLEPGSYDPRTGAMSLRRQTGDDPSRPGAAAAGEAAQAGGRPPC